MLAKCTVLLLFLAGCPMPPAARPAGTLGKGDVYVGSVVGGAWGSEKRPDFYPPLGLLNHGLNVRLGIGADCEVGTDLTYSRQGTDLRCAPLNAFNEDVITIAPILGVAYLPMRGVEWRGGVDFGATLGPIHPTAHIGVSHSPRFFFSNSPPPLNPNGSAYDRNSRTETRLETSLGVGVGLIQDSQILLGVNPYWRIDEPIGLRPDGITITVGGGRMID